MNFSLFLFVFWVCSGAKEQKGYLTVSLWDFEREDRFILKNLFAYSFEDNELHTVVLGRTFKEASVSDIFMLCSDNPVVNLYLYKRLCAERFNEFIDFLSKNQVVFEDRELAMDLGLMVLAVKAAGQSNHGKWIEFLKNSKSLTEAKVYMDLIASHTPKERWQQVFWLQMQVFVFRVKQNPFKFAFVYAICLAFFYHLHKYERKLENSEKKISEETPLLDEKI